MMASEAFFELLVWSALGITLVGPLLLIALLVRDWRAGKLW